MKNFIALMLAFLIAGCVEEKEARKGPGGDVILPLLVDLPIVPFQESTSSLAEDLLKVRIEEGRVAYFWNWMTVRGDRRELSDIVLERKGGLAVTLRIWATPGTKASLVRAMIEDAKNAGVSKVEFVVKGQDPSAPVGVLSLDLPRVGGDTRFELCDLLVNLDSDGLTSMRTESGVDELLAFPDELARRLELFKTVAETGGMETTLLLSVEGEANHGRFCEVLSILRLNSDYVFLTSPERRATPAIPIPFKVPEPPAAPESFPSIPKFD